MRTRIVPIFIFIVATLLTSLPLTKVIARNLNSDWTQGNNHGIPVVTTGDNPLNAHNLSLQDARQIAQAHLSDQTAKGRAPTWEGATLGAPQPMLDLQGATIAYLFLLSNTQGPAGYIVVAETKGTPRVVEFATSGSSPLEGSLQRAEAAAQLANAALIKGVPIYLGPLEYLYETAPTSQGERRFYSVGTANLLVLPREIEKELLSLAPQLESSAEPVAIQGYHRIDGVPEWQQFHDGLACYSGCVPTAVATIMGYWDAWHGNLIGDNWHDAVLSIRNFMGTQCGGNTGWTTMDANTAVLYPHSRGYNFTAEHGADPSLSITIAEVNANRPILLGFYPNSRWSQGHSVVGIGYNDQYLIVRDNWPGLSVETQVLSRPFWTIRFCPPGQNCSSQPPQLVCPQTGGVLLYQHSDYSCGNEEEGKGFVRQNQSGPTNDLGSFDNRASSIRVPTGWSVALYEHSSQGGGTYCVNAPGLNNFSGYTFNNSVSLNGNVSSFQVFTNENCAPATPNNRTDNTPPSGYYTSPSSGSTVERVVTLAASASDDQSGVTKVQFGGLWGGQWHVLGEDVDQPYEYTWDLCAAGVPDGEIQLGLKITDQAGNLFQIPPDQLPHIYKSYNCAPSGSWWMWSAQYWNDKDFGGDPVSSAIVGGPWPYLFFHWGDGSPSQGVNSDNWAVRYTQTFYFPGDNYRFHCQHDDGCRIFVDGVNWIDAWWPGYGGHDMTRYLDPGNHSVTVEFMDISGDARLEVWWQGAGYLPHDVLPDNIGEYSHYWRAEYWVFTEFLDTTPQFTRLEEQTLDHNWGDGGPDPMLPTDNFRSKFTRLADFDCGDYRFTISADDGVRFTVDDQRWLDEWHDQVASFTIDHFMPHGTHSLRVDHYERTGGSQISLSWMKLNDCSVSISPQYVSQMYVKPNEWFAPTVRLQVDSGYLDPLRSDTLERVGGASFGGNQEYLRDTVESGQRYSFDANSPDAFWLNTFGYSEGTYNSDWQIRLGGGNLVGSVNSLQVVVDGTPPTLQIVSPSVHETLSGSPVNIQVNAVDSLSGLEQVEFFAGYDNGDGAGWQWHKLGTDTNATDGWNWAWYTENVPPQTSAAIFAYGWDKSHNGQAAIATDLVINNGSSTHIYLPLVLNNYGTSSGSGIHGNVTYQGSPVEGINVQLRFYDGSSWSVVRDTTTQADGTYSFADAPSLAAGQKYYVRFLNGSTGGNYDNPNYLYLWHSFYITSYIAGNSVTGGDFDIADIPLVSPADGATVALPYTFQWTAREAMSSDSYEFDLYDPADSDPWWWTDPALGYVNSYTLNNLPSGFTAGTQYMWEIWVYSSDGGYGISYDSYSVTFSGSSSGPELRIDPASGPLGTQFNIYGTGFTPGETIQNWIIYPTGDRFDDPTPPTADSQGNFSSWVQPGGGSPTGTYTVYARGDQSQQTVSASFQITSQQSLQWHERNDQLERRGGD